jgi:hypothetical protein
MTSPQLKYLRYLYIGSLIKKRKNEIMRKNIINFLK